MGKHPCEIQRSAGPRAWENKQRDSQVRQARQCGKIQLLVPPECTIVHRTPFVGGDHLPPPPPPRLLLVLTRVPIVGTKVNPFSSRQVRARCVTLNPIVAHIATSSPTARPFESTPIRRHVDPALAWPIAPGRPVTNARAEIDAGAKVHFRKWRHQPNRCKYHPVPILTKSMTRMIQPGRASPSPCSMRPPCG